MPFCPTCGRPADQAALYCQSCGAGIRPEPVTENIGNYAGFWKRVGAWAIDAVVLSIVLSFLLSASGRIFPGLFIPWLYEAWLHSSEWQATLGKRALNIVVTGVNGGRISFARATGRHFAKWISAGTFLVGFIMAAFTARKQALHDLIAGTIVVNR